MSNHALVFKVLRLRPSDLLNSDQKKSHFNKDVSSTAQFRDHPLESGTSVSENWIERKEKGQLGVGGAQNFGTVYLGQTLTVAVALCNQSDAEVNNVGIRIEIQSDHGKSILYDTMPTQGIPLLPPGAHHEFIVKHDVRDLGPQTILCASAYVTPAFPNEPKYSPQAFKFNVLNPLIVRTKHRALDSNTVFLEATIENKTEDLMLLESVELAVASGYSSQNIISSSENEGKSDDISTYSSSSVIGPLGEHTINSAALLLHPGGGAAGYIFKLSRLWHQQQQQQQQQQVGTNSSGARSPTGASPRGTGDQDGSALGKLDIRWKGTLGDPARLQTQIITGNPRPHRELRLEVIKLPDRIVVAEPFTIEICVVSGVDRRLGPLKISYHPAWALKASSMSGPIRNGSSVITTREGAGVGVEERASEEGIVLDGLQSECINEVPPRSRAHLTLSMLPRLPGRQYIQGLILTDERDGRVFDTLAPIEVWVGE
ncbi:hypothetical protein Ndes2526B_g06052 [Nannochloris sp. 'desiccata']|nr:putative Trafficking protein particle complex subunit 13-like protein [Chlorella desiccata (nom. nud.)]